MVRFVGMQMQYKALWAPRERVNWNFCSQWIESTRFFFLFCTCISILRQFRSQLFNTSYWIDIDIFFTFSSCFQIYEYYFYKESVAIIFSQTFLESLLKKGCYVNRGRRYYMDPLAFEKFESAIFFKIFKIPSNGQLV